MTIPVAKDPLLEGKKGLIVGIANDRSIAWGCARAFRAFGAELAVTYLNEKAKPYVEPLAKAVDAGIFMPQSADQRVHRRRAGKAQGEDGARSLEAHPRRGIVYGQLYHGGEKRPGRFHLRVQFRGLDGDESQPMLTAGL